MNLSRREQYSSTDILAYSCIAWVLNYVYLRCINLSAPPWNGFQLSLGASVFAHYFAFFKCQVLLVGCFFQILINSVWHYFKKRKRRASFSVNFLIHTSTEIFAIFILIYLGLVLSPMLVEIFLCLVTILLSFWSWSLRSLLASWRN